MAPPLRSLARVHQALQALTTRSRWALGLSLTVFLLLMLGLALVDFLRVKRLTEELAADQARALIAHVEQSTQRAALAEDLVRQTVDDQLFAASRLLERLLEQSAGSQDWSRLAAEAGVSRLDLYAWDLRWLAGSQGEGTPFPRSSLMPHEQTWTTGQFSDSLSGATYHGVVRRLTDGRLLRVALDSALLLEMRRSVGVGALLQDLARHAEVRYAVLDSPGQFLAATPNLPEWVERPGEQEHDEALASESFQTVLIQSPEGPVHEARTPFHAAPGTVLRLGLVQPGLQQILQRSLWAILLRTLLVMGLGGLGLVLLLSRQSLRLLEQEKALIQEEVRGLEAGRQLQERQVAMGSLAGGVAHEIRGPLNTIAMAAQRLEFQLDPQKHHDRYQEIVRSIRREAQRMERIVADFLSFARPPQVQRTVQDPALALRQVTLTFASLARAQGVEFVEELQGLPLANLDADAFRQAVLNLLMNALQAMQGREGRIRLSARRQGRMLVLYVEDNGPGVPEEQGRAIFDLYFTTRADGTGLGLPLVQRFAAQHGGRVELRESQGGGATFILSLECEA